MNTPQITIDKKKFKTACNDVMLMKQIDEFIAANYWMIEQENMKELLKPIPVREYMGSHSRDCWSILAVNIPTWMSIIVKRVGCSSEITQMSADDVYEY